MACNLPLISVDAREHGKPESAAGGTIWQGDLPNVLIQPGFEWLGITWQIVEHRLVFGLSCEDRWPSG